MSPDDLAALISPAGQQALAEHAAANPQQLALNAARYAPLPIRAVAEQLSLRQRYGHKFGDWLPRMLLQQNACEQAASQGIARWKARHLLGKPAGLVIDCCAGLGSDSLAVAEAGHATQAWEHDPLLAQLLAHNASSLGLALHVQHGDGCSDLAQADMVLADPDRRASGRRSLHPADWSPTPEHIFAAASTARCIILKLPVGGDPTALATPGQRQLIVLSQAGEAREQLLLIFPQEDALDSPARAVGLDQQGAVRFDISADPTAAAPPAVSWEQPGPVFIEPDPALIRSGLIAHCAQQHDLQLVHPLVAYLHGADPGPGFPGRRYRVIASAPWQQQDLRRTLRQHGISRLRISRRHFPWSGEDIHQRLRSREGGSMRLFCYRNGDENMAWTLAEPLAQ